MKETKVISHADRNKLMHLLTDLDNDYHLIREKLTKDIRIDLLRKIQKVSFQLSKISSELIGKIK